MNNKSIKDYFIKYGVARLVIAILFFALLYYISGVLFDFYPDNLDIEYTTADNTEDLINIKDDNFKKIKYDLSDVALYQNDNLNIKFNNSIYDVFNKDFNFILKDISIKNGVATEIWVADTKGVNTNYIFDYYTITTNAANSFLKDSTNDIKNVQIQLLIDDEPQLFSKREGFTYYYHKSKDTKKIKNIKIVYETKITNQNAENLTLAIKDFGNSPLLNDYYIKDNIAFENWAYEMRLPLDIDPKSYDNIANRMLSGVNLSRFKYIDEYYKLNDSRTKYILNRTPSKNEKDIIMDVFLEYGLLKGNKIDINKNQIALQKTTKNLFINDASCDISKVKAELYINGYEFRFDSVFYDYQNLYFVFDINREFKKENENKPTTFADIKSFKLTTKTEILNSNQIDLLSQNNIFLSLFQNGDDKVVENWTLDLNQPLILSQPLDYIVINPNFNIATMINDSDDEEYNKNFKLNLLMNDQKIEFEKIENNLMFFKFPGSLKKLDRLVFEFEYSDELYSRISNYSNSTTVDYKNITPRLLTVAGYTKNYDRTILSKFPYQHLYYKDVNERKYNYSTLEIDLKSIMTDTKSVVVIKSSLFNTRILKKIKVSSKLSLEDISKIFNVASKSDSKYLIIEKKGNEDNINLLSSKYTIILSVYKNQKNIVTIVFLILSVIIYFISFFVIQNFVIQKFASNKKRFFIRIFLAVIVLFFGIFVLFMNKLTIKVDLNENIKDGTVDLYYEKNIGIAQNNKLTQNTTTKCDTIYPVFKIPFLSVKRFMITSNINNKPDLVKQIEFKFRTIPLKKIVIKDDNKYFSTMISNNLLFFVSKFNPNKWIKIFYLLTVFITLFFSLYFFFLFDSIVSAIKDFIPSVVTVKKLYSARKSNLSINSFFSVIFIYGLLIITLSSIKFKINAWVYLIIFLVVIIYLLGAFYERLFVFTHNLLDKSNRSVFTKNVIIFFNRNIIKNKLLLFINGVATLLFFVLYNVIKIQILKTASIIIFVFALLIINRDKIIGFLITCFRVQRGEEYSTTNFFDRIKKNLTEIELNSLITTLFIFVVVVSANPLLLYIELNKNINTIVIVLTIIFGVMVFAVNRKKIDSIEEEKQKELEEEKQRLKEFDEKYGHLKPPEKYSLWYNIKLLFKKDEKEK